MDATKPCKLCGLKESKYICPRCNIPYCSLACYQSEAHTQCSESFYKDCVVEQIKNEELDPQSQKNMMEILQRVQEVDSQVENDDMIDSDDESDSDELSKRLAGVDLEDADQVWDRLTEEEKRQFEELLRSGDVSEVVPTWQPWWFYRDKKKLVEDIENESQLEEASKMKSACPLHNKNIQPFSKLSKVTPSPCVRWGVVNVLAAYSLTTRVYNGDHQSAAVEGASTLVSLSRNLGVNQVFERSELAIADVHMAAVNSKCLVEGVDELQLGIDVQMLIEGPSEARKNHYVLSALSDIHVLFTTAKRKAKECSSSKSKGEFSKKFSNLPNPLQSGINHHAINKYIMKIEFYLSFAKEYF